MYDVKTSLPLPDTSPPEPAAEPSWQPVGEAATLRSIEDSLKRVRRLPLTADAIRQA